MHTWCSVTPCVFLCVSLTLVPTRNLVPYHGEVRPLLCKLSGDL